MAYPDPKIKNIEDLPLIITPMMVTQILGISKTSAYELWNNPEFPGFLSGRQKFVSREGFCRFMKVPEDIILQTQKTAQNERERDPDALSPVPQTSLFEKIWAVS